MAFIKYSIANLELINQDEPEWLKESAKVRLEDSDVKKDNDSEEGEEKGE